MTGAARQTPNEGERIMSDIEELVRAAALARFRDAYGTEYDHNDTQDRHLLAEIMVEVRARLQRPEMAR